jgi:hypothetical protein
MARPEVKGIRQKENSKITRHTEQQTTSSEYKVAGWGLGIRSAAK